MRRKIYKRHDLKKQKLNHWQTVLIVLGLHFSKSNPSFALYTDCLPTCSQSLLKHDWPIALGPLVEPESFQYQKFCPLLTDS